MDGTTLLASSSIIQSMVGNLVLCCRAGKMKKFTCSENSGTIKHSVREVTATDLKLLSAVLNKDSGLVIMSRIVSAIGTGG